MFYRKTMKRIKREVKIAEIAVGVSTGLSVIATGVAISAITQNRKLEKEVRELNMELSSQVAELSRLEKENKHDICLCSDTIRQIASVRN